MVILRSSSSGRQSAALVPLATRPCVFTALEMNSTASIREVLPLEACPTTGTAVIKKGMDSKNFKIGEKTKYATADKKDAAVTDIKVGDKVKVTYAEEC